MSTWYAQQDGRFNEITWNMEPDGSGPTGFPAAGDTLNSNDRLVIASLSELSVGFSLVGSFQTIAASADNIPDSSLDQTEMPPLAALASAPLATHTSEGTVKERTVDEYIKAKQFIAEESATRPPWGLCLARSIPPGTDPGSPY